LTEAKPPAIAKYGANGDEFVFLLVFDISNASI